MIRTNFVFKGDEAMRINKLYIVFGMLIAFGVFFELAAHADEAYEATTITFSAPVQIPGRVLPAGTYVFQQANSDDLNLIQISNPDHSVLYATLETAPADRMNSTAHTAIELAEPESGTPILVKWFYPGRMTGHEFVYPKEQQEIAQSKQEVLLGNGTTGQSCTCMAGERKGKMVAVIEDDESYRVAVQRAVLWSVGRLVVARLQVRS